MYIDDEREAFLLMHIENTIPKWKTYVVLMCNTMRNIGA